MSRDQIQVLVIGAGVAGCTTALMLDGTGLGVAMVERSVRDSSVDDFGESLTPAGVRDLALLGLNEVESSFGRRTYGVQSAWSGNDVVLRSFAAAVPAHGLQIDKQQLVQLLRSRVEATGTKIHYGCRLGTTRPNSDGSHIVSLDLNGTRTEVAVRALVDATGRSRTVARRHTEILHYDRLVATISQGRGAVRSPGGPSLDTSFTEAVSDGWWYSAHCHRGQRIAIRFSDEHEEITKRLRSSAFFWEQLRATQWTSQLFADADTASSIRIRSAATTALRHYAGPGWVAVGDAARTVDPLSSQGIHNSIRDGIRIANEIKACSADPEGMTALSCYLREGQDEYFRQRSAVYGVETRWPYASFWKLRKD